MKKIALMSVFFYISLKIFVFLYKFKNNKYVSCAFFFILNFDYYIITIDFLFKEL